MKCVHCGCEFGGSWTGECPLCEQAIIAGWVRDNKRGVRFWCRMCGEPNGRHKEWCATGRNWLPTWFMRLFTVAYRNADL